jgi:hypothetical protein
VGLDPFIELVANGVSLHRVCTELEVSFAAVLAYINADVNRKARYESARRAAADAYADKATEVLQYADTTQKAEVTRAAALAKHYEWLAERADPKRYMPKAEAPQGGGPNGPSVTFVWNSPAPPALERPVIDVKPEAA